MRIRERLSKEGTKKVSLSVENGQLRVDVDGSPASTGQPATPTVSVVDCSYELENIYHNIVLSDLRNDFDINREEVPVDVQTTGSRKTSQAEVVGSCKSKRGSVKGKLTGHTAASEPASKRTSKHSLKVRDEDNTL